MDNGANEADLAKKEENPVVKAEKKAELAKAEKTNWARLHGSWRDRIEHMLPEPRMIDQFLYCAETQYGKNKAAFDGVSAVSMLTCLMTCAKYGILPDGRNAYLIPYGTDCTLQFDYKGLVHVIIRDGVARSVYADVVCANDKFTFRNGQVELHEVSLPRGEVLGAYCKIVLPDGSAQYEVMDREEIETIKKCSKGSSSPSSPWNKFFKEMAKKTVFRRATKWLKLSPDVIDAIGADDEQFDFNERPAVASQRQKLFERPSEPVAIDVHSVPQKQPEPVAVPAKTLGEAKAEAEAMKKSADLPF